MTGQAFHNGWGKRIENNRGTVDLLHIPLTLFVAIAGFIIGRRLSIPVPAMIGSMLAVGIFSASTGFAVMPPAIKMLSQGISGAFIGMSVTRRDVRNIPHMVKPLVMLLVMLTANTILLGFAFHLLFGWDLMTGLLSCVAGGIADVSLIAMDLNADASTVAIMQTVRLASVLAIFPTWIAFMTRDEPAINHEPLDMTQDASDTWLDRIIDTPQKRTAFTLVISIAFGAAGYMSGVPAGALLFSLVGVGTLNLTTDACYMPMPVKRAAQVLAGSLVGSTVTPETVSHLGQLIGPLIIMFVMYMLLNYLFSLIASKTGMLDMRSALFASSPGGASDMALIAADLGADLTKIAVLQIFRAIYAAGIMPQVAILCVHLWG